MPLFEKPVYLFLHLNEQGLIYRGTPMTSNSYTRRPETLVRNLHLLIRRTCKDSLLRSAEHRGLATVRSSFPDHFTRCHQYSCPCMSLPYLRSLCINATITILDRYLCPALNPYTPSSNLYGLLPGLIEFCILQQL